MGRRWRWWVAGMALGLLIALVGSGPAFAGTTHTVQPGETLYRIARTYGVTLEALAAHNGLADPTRIKAGQVLRIPERDTTIPPTVPAAREPVPGRGTPALAASAPSVEPSATSHTVQAGDTLYRIARQHGVTVDALMQANRLTGETIKTGQVLVIPGGPLSPAPSAETPLTPPPARPAAPPPAPSFPSPASGAGAGVILRDATRLMGTPYQWGGTTLRGLDCSGFIYVTYAPWVPNLPRTSFEMFKIGTPVEMADLRPGDLVFFTTYAPGASHVGIYLGDGRFIHSSSIAGRVVITSLSDTYYATRYLGARRILAW